MLWVEVEKQLGDFNLAAKFNTGAGATALFGPSGSGKTTIVNMIAGLVTPDAGRIGLNDTMLFHAQIGVNVPPYRRRIGYVFQEGRLFPHFTVAQNLDYGRWMRGLPRIPAEFDRIVALLDIAPLLPRHRTRGRYRPAPVRPWLSPGSGSLYSPRNGPEDPPIPDHVAYALRLGSAGDLRKWRS